MSGSWASCKPAMDLASEKAAALTADRAEKLRKQLLKLSERLGRFAREGAADDKMRDKLLERMRTSRAKICKCLEPEKETDKPAGGKK